LLDNEGVFYEKIFDLSHVCNEYCRLFILAKNICAGLWVDAYESRNLALLRAAQITSNEGYSHFKVINGEVYDNGPNRLGSHIGIGVGNGGFGRTRYNGHVGVAVDDVVRAVEGSKVTEIIEVVLLSSAPQNDPSVFAADSIIRNIVPPKAP